ncbi:MAG: type VI secretion system baseplate subunit TssK [Gemmatimonadetes bacterium]|nr:type VI secretion system baseplate subunit TssK [Gemmatimonadota bacterium]
MEALTRIVWSEGMHLAQHHFQAQGAYFERLAGGALGDLFHTPYGLIACDFDREALLNGTVAVLAARGIMPDGLAFSFPEEPAPQPLAVRELFSPTQPAHQVLLAIPPELPGRANCELPGGRAAAGAARFTASERLLPDEVTGGSERPVQLARKNFRLLLDNEPHDELVTMPIARVQRDGTGHFVYDPGWVGPALRIGASERLRTLVARLADMLSERAAAMTAERAGSAGSAEYAPREVAGFWFLHALNTVIPTLRHWQRTGAAHPEQLYLLLAQLGGALCTFSLTSQPRDLPEYDHDHPEECFAALERHIRQHLDVVLPTQAINLPVRPGQAGFFGATVTDRRCFLPGSLWYLGIRSSAPGADVIGRGSKLVKLCSAKFIARLVKEAYPGLELEHAPRAPAELSPRVGTHYFTLRRTDPCWRSIVETGEVGIYAPAALPDVELELKVILERS